MRLTQFRRWLRISLPSADSAYFHYDHMNPSPETVLDELPLYSGTGSFYRLKSIILCVISCCMLGCANDRFTMNEKRIARIPTRISQVDQPVNKSVEIQASTLKMTAARNVIALQTNRVANVRAVSQFAPNAEPIFVAPQQPYFVIQPETIIFGPPCCDCVPCVPPCRLNFCDDLNHLPNRVADESYALLTWENAIFLGAATGVTLAIRDNVDARVTHDNELHGPRWNNLSEVLSHGGDAFLVHAPLLIGLYTFSLCQQNDDLHELALTMATSYKVTVVSALALQYITGTRDTGNSLGDIFKDSGFPSEPTAASFALAAVIDERYGWQGGLPAYLLSGLIGWSEIDQNKHTVSDVVFGAALGYMIGKSIGAFHYRPNDPFALVPFVDGATGTQGMGIQFQY